MSTPDITRPTSVFDNDITKAWAIYHAHLCFTGRLIGGNPSDPKLIEGWVKKNLGVTDEEQLRDWTIDHLSKIGRGDPREATTDEVDAAADAFVTEKHAQVFKRLDGVPYVEGRHAKAMLKEGTNIAYPRGRHKWGQYRGKNGLVGGKAPISFVAERVFVPERPILIEKGEVGYDLAVGHPKDRFGETTANLTYYEYAEGAEIDIEVRSFDDLVTPEQWSRIWSAAEMNGLGARRSQGAGQFVVTEWEKVG